VTTGYFFLFSLLLLVFILDSLFTIRASSSIGVWRGVSKGVEDGCRPQALLVGYP
jgi:hypothetical protein